MQGSQTDRSTPVGAVLALVGGALLVIGSFLDWAEVSGTGTSVTATGTDGTDGWITFIAGALMLGAGLVLVRGVTRRGMAVLAIVAGLVGGGVGLYDALTAKDSVLDSAAEELVRQYGGSVAQVRALLDAAIEVGELGITIAVGLYLVIAGGVLGVIGGSVSLRQATRTPTMPAIPTIETPPVPPVPDPWSTGTASDAPTSTTSPPATAAPGAMPAPPPSPEASPEPPSSPPPEPSVGTEPEPPAAPEPSDVPEAQPPPSPWAPPEPPGEDRSAGDDESR